MGAGLVEVQWADRAGLVDPVKAQWVDREDPVEVQWEDPVKVQWEDPVAQVKVQWVDPVDQVEVPWVDRVDLVVALWAVFGTTLVEEINSSRVLDHADIIRPLANPHAMIERSI